MVADSPSASSSSDSSSSARRQPRRPRRSFGKLGKAQDAQDARGAGRKQGYFADASFTTGAGVGAESRMAPESPEDEQSMTRDYYTEQAPPHWGKTL